MCNKNAEVEPDIFAIQSQFGPDEQGFLAFLAEEVEKGKSRVSL